jgi:hypothetical protein
MPPDELPRRTRRWLRCRNAAASTIDAYSVLQVVDTTVVRGRAVLEVEPCDAEGARTRPLAALGPTRMSSGKYGWCTMQWPAWVRVGGPAGHQNLMGPTDASPGVLSLAGLGFILLGNSLPDPWRTQAFIGRQYFNPRKLRFRLPESGLVATQQVEAGAEGLNRYDGYGNKPVTTPIWNLPIRSDYLFRGSGAKNGLAIYDDRRDRYYILNMESP